MEAKGYQPWQAMMMFPPYPKGYERSHCRSIPDPYRDGAYAVDVEVHASRQIGKKG